MMLALGCFYWDGTDRAYIWYWVNLMRIEKERHLAPFHIVNHICRGQYQHASPSPRYADLCAFSKHNLSGTRLVSCSFAVCPLFSCVLFGHYFLAFGSWSLLFLWPEQGTHRLFAAVASAMLISLQVSNSTQSECDGEKSYLFIHIFLSSEGRLPKHPKLIRHTYWKPAHARAHVVN